MVNNENVQVDEPDDEVKVAPAEAAAEEQPALVAPADQAAAEPNPEPVKKRSAHQIYDRRTGTYHDAADWEIENEFHKAHIKKGLCPYKCKLHSKPCQLGDKHAHGCRCTECGV